MIGGGGSYYYYSIYPQLQTGQGRYRGNGFGIALLYVKYSLKTFQQKNVRPYYITLWLN